MLDCVHFLMGRLDALGGELHGHECYFVDPENALILIKGDVVFLQSMETGGKMLVVLAYGATVDGYVVNPSYARDTR